MVETVHVSRSQVLLAGVDDATARRIVRLLYGTFVDLLRAPWGARLSRYVVETTCDVMILGCPTSDGELLDFLSAIRAGNSLSRRVGLVLLAQPERVDDARSLVGKGVNRVVSMDYADRELRSAVLDLARVAPRANLRAAVRVFPASAGENTTLNCQTENLSATGMLLRGEPCCAVGTSLGFTISIPGEKEPILGEGRVGRTTDLSRESVEGFSVSFVSLVGSDRERLTGIVDRHLS